MTPVSAPISPGDAGPNVANLQDVLLALLERDAIRVDDPRNPSAGQVLRQQLIGERSISSYGIATQYVVLLAQIQEGLGDGLGGGVEETTAAVLNRLVNLFMVQGTVRRESVGNTPGKPWSGVAVHAFDQDISDSVLLGTAVTDTAGEYRITFSKETFTDGDQGGAVLQRDDRLLNGFVDSPRTLPATLPAPDLWVGVPDDDGGFRVRSDVIFNAGQSTTIDLVFNDATIIRSELDILVGNVAPRLEGVALESLTPEQVDFLSRDTELPKEQIEALVLAAQFAVQAESILRRRVAPEMLTPFYGLIRVGASRSLDALLALGIVAWQPGLESAVSQGIISLETPRRIDDWCRVLATLRLRTIG